MTANEERMRQLVLKFAGERRCTLGDFEAGPNQELVAEIGRRARGSEFGVVWPDGRYAAARFASTAAWQAPCRR